MYPVYNYCIRRREEFGVKQQMSTMYNYITHAFTVKNNNIFLIVNALKQDPNT